MNQEFLFDAATFKLVKGDNNCTVCKAILQFSAIIVSITEQFTPLVQSPVRHTIVPPSLLVSEFEVLRDVNNLSSSKAPGPDWISNQIFKVFQDH